MNVVAIRRLAHTGIWPNRNRYIFIGVAKLQASTESHDKCCGGQRLLLILLLYIGEHKEREERQL